MMNDTFRGYLILARDMNNMNVGRFTAGANQRLACSVSIVDDIYIV